MSIDVFISHHTKSSLHITQAICNSLEAQNIRCWYAPRDTQGVYADSITQAIGACRIFILVLNRASSFSQDVLSEINLAVERLRRGENIAILPFQIADEEVSASAKYYIGRMHWIDAITPPIEERIKELCVQVSNLLGRMEPMRTGGRASEQARTVLQSQLSLPNYNFIGRQKELGEIADFLEQYSMVFLYGPGGVGKTELAKQYVHVNAKKYDTIIMMSFERSLQELLVSDKYIRIENFRRKMMDGEPESDLSFGRRKLEEVKRLTTDRTLFIIDNFDTEEDELLEEFLNGPYQILITARTNFEYLGVPTLAVGALEKQEQWELFYKNYKHVLTEKEKEAVREILELVEGHTLAVELIAKLMSLKRLKPENMLNQLRATGISPQMSGNVRHGFRKAATVYGHIEALYDLDKLSEEELQIMMNLSFLPIGGVSVGDFLEWSEKEWAEEIDGLIMRSWVQYDMEKDVISLHPVIADIVRSKFEAHDERCKTMLLNLAERFKMTWSIQKERRVEYGEIAKAVYERLPQVSAENMLIYKGIFNVCRNLDYFELCRKILTDMKQGLGDEESIELAWFYFIMGDFCLAYQYFDEAVKFVKQSISILERVYPNSYDLAYFTKHLSHIYHAIFEHREKNPMYIRKARKCLEDSAHYFAISTAREETAYGSKYYSFGQTGDTEHDEQTASRLYALGVNHFWSGEYEEALRCESESFDIFMRAFGERNSDTTAPMRILARTYSKLGRFEEAIQMQERVIRIRGQLWGTDQFDYFRQFEALAEIYFDKGDVAEGLQKLKYILELMGDKKELYANYFSKIQKRIEDTFQRYKKE